MHKSILLGSVFALAVTSPALAAPWVRSYVVSAYEPAFYWGGKLSYRKGELISPGTDCPGGNTPALNYEKVTQTKWRNAAQAHALLYPPGQEDDANLRLRLQMRAVTFRGPRPDIDVYINPFTMPDPGQDEVVGKIADGFNLDGNAKTGGFTSPDGVRGIDNAYYRAWGCMGSFRGMPYHAALSIRTTDKMLEGLFTIVVRLSGNKDPMNDDNVTMEIGYSPDHPVKGGNDKVVGSYSFRMVKNAEYTRMKGAVKNGVVESEQISELHMPKFGWFMQNQGDADFHKGRLRLVLDKSGSAQGLVGGYRDWREVYAENAFPQDGSTQEIREHQNLIGQYYALKRNADGMPDAKTGKNMGISIAYRFKAMPAYVIDPAVPANIYLPEVSKRAIKRMHGMHDVFFKAIATNTVQPIPRDSREGAPDLIQLANGRWVVDRKANAFAQPSGKAAPAAPSDKPEPSKPTPAKQDMVKAETPDRVASVTR